MGCSTCKQKKENNPSNEGDKTDINLLPESFTNGEFSGSIIFKIIAFVIITAAIPLIILALLGQLFFAFFAPKKLPKITKRLKSGGMYIFKKYVEFKYRRSIKKREKQFGNNKGYEQDSELTDIEVLSDISVHDNNNKK